jgi:hypothetical protein
MLVPLSPSSSGTTSIKWGTAYAVPSTMSREWTHWDTTWNSLNNQQVSWTTSIQPTPSQLVFPLEVFQLKFCLHFSFLCSVACRAVFAPSCISHSVLTKKDWQSVKIDEVSLPQALRCWEMLHTHHKWVMTHP